MRAISKRLLAGALCAMLLAGSATALAAGGYHEYGEHDYSAEGLKPVLADNTWGYFQREYGAPDEVWNYVDKSGKVLDLNQGRFGCMFEFYEGMAAVVDDETGKVGYINTAGKLVIPCQFGVYSGMGDQFVGYFKNGIAPVLEKSVGFDPNFSGNETFALGYIDKTGRLTKPYVTVSNENAANSLIGYAFLGDNGHVWDEEPEEPQQDISIWFEDLGLNLDNGYAYHYTLTNNTAASIKKYAALVTYEPEMFKDLVYDEKTNRFVRSGKPVFYGQIHAIDIDLAAGASVEKPFVSSLGNVSTLSVAWIDFDSLAERDSFLKDRVFSEISIQDLQGYRYIDANTGAAWMKDTLGIAIKPVK